MGEPIVGYYVCLEDTTGAGGAGGAHREAGGAAPDLADTISGLAVAVCTAVAEATEGERVASCTKGENERNTVNIIKRTVFEQLWHTGALYTTLVKIYRGRKDE